MIYSAIIFDLDGTAIPNVPNGMPSDKLVNAIRAAKPSIRLCAATGRPITNAKPILDKLNLGSPCIISAGTQIVDPKTSHILWQVSLDNSSVKAILSICAPYNYELLFNNELMGEGEQASKRFVKDNINVVYIMGCTKTDAKIILDKLLQIPTITASGVLSWKLDGVDIHITHKSATKEHAIHKLLEMLSITKERTIGVGDANNDIHLFKAVGYKIAMQNGTKLLKSHADEICDSVENDGLAKVINKYAG